MEFGDFVPKRVNLWREDLRRFSGRELLDSVLMLEFFCISSTANLCEAMKKRRDIPVVQEIGDVLLARVSRAFLLS